MMINSPIPTPNIEALPILLRDRSLLPYWEIKKSAAFSIEQALGFATLLLKNIGIDTALLDSRLLLGHVKGLDSLGLLVNKEQLLSQQEFGSFAALLARRLCFEPMAYIIGKREFFGFDFHVSPACLIPRPDTETLVERCLELLEPSRDCLFWDICCGSGAIAISILKNRPKARAIASDICIDALAIAKKNAHNLLVSDHLQLLEGDLFEPFKLCAKADLIVSNPPYIGLTEYEALAPDLKNYEPKAALIAGDEEGIAFYRRLINEAPQYLKSGGYLVLEIGYKQAHLVKNLLSPDFSLVGIYEDLAANPRVVVLKKME